jgi:hypothetical protein
MGHKNQSLRIEAPPYFSPQKVTRTIPITAPIPEAIIPETNKVDCEKSSLIMEPSTRLPKLNFVASRKSLPRFRKKKRN